MRLNNYSLFTVALLNELKLCAFLCSYEVKKIHRSETGRSFYVSLYHSKNQKSLKVRLSDHRSFKNTFAADNKKRVSVRSDEVFSYSLKNCIDVLCAFAGVDPSSVSTKIKTPFIGNGGFYFYSVRSVRSNAKKK